MSLPSLTLFPVYLLSKKAKRLGVQRFCKSTDIKSSFEMISDLFELLLRVVESCIIHIQLYKPEVSSETSATEYRKLKKKKIIIIIKM